MLLDSHSRDAGSSPVLHIFALKLRKWRHIQTDNENIKKPSAEYPKTKFDLDHITNSCSNEQGTMRPDLALSGSVRAFLPGKFMEDKHDSPSIYGRYRTHVDDGR